MREQTPGHIEASYRTFYGKLFAALFKQFGGRYVNQIEDAIQNTFYKSLRSWPYDQMPKDPESWLFRVARNDLLNQLKRESRQSEFVDPGGQTELEHPQEDLRLQTMLFLSKNKRVSTKVKVIFMLKNIFGLHIKEISASTLLSQEALYKSIKRAKKAFQETARPKDLELNWKHMGEAEIAMVEEILYAVFNIGFDSFSEKVHEIIHDDLCLEALALAKLLSQKFAYTSSKNLMALFCFHLARIPAKIQDGKLIAFFQQDQRLWKEEFVKLGFHYLEKPQQLNKYYVEALIASKHMMTPLKDREHWQEIIKLYQLLLSLVDSPLVRLNLCYCLKKAERVEEAMHLLKEIEKELPHEHIYLSLVKAHILKDSQTNKSEQLLAQVLSNMSQEIRRNFILENLTTDP